MLRTTLRQLARARALPSRTRAYTTGPSRTQGLGHVLLGTAIGVVFTGLYVTHTSTSPTPAAQATPAPELSKSDAFVTGPGEKHVKVDAETLAQELRTALGDDDRVSTDSEVLHVHGYSENDYHPGA